MRAARMCGTRNSRWRATPGLPLRSMWWRRRRSPAPATTVVQPVQVLRTPGALDNMFRTLQTLPGVAATEEFGSRLAVRGGSPDQNLTVMDGVEIHDPYRLFGLTSAFNPETIQRFELATGGFSVKYGDRLSSLLVDRESRRHASGQGLGGSAALSITDANVVTRRRAAWRRRRLVAGDRRAAPTTTWSRRASPTRNFPASPTCRPRVTWEPAPGRKLSLFGLRSRQAAAVDDRRRRCARRVPGRHRRTTWRGRALTASLGSARAVAHHRRLLRIRESTFGVDAVVREHRAAIECAGRRRLRRRQRDLRARAGACATCRCGRSSAGRSASTSSTIGARGASARRPTLRFQIDGDRNPTAANGSSVQGGAGLPDLLSVDQPLDAYRRVAAGRVADRRRARRCRPACAWITPAPPARCCCHHA